MSEKKWAVDRMKDASQIIDLAWGIIESCEYIDTDVIVTEDYIDTRVTMSDEMKERAEKYAKEIINIARRV